MEILCPGCRKVLRVPDGTIGRRVRCWSCRERFIIPDPDAASLDTITGFAIDPLDRRVAMRQENQWRQGTGG